MLKKSTQECGVEIEKTRQMQEHHSINFYKHHQISGGLFSPLFLFFYIGLVLNCLCNQYLSCNWYWCITWSALTQQLSVWSFGILHLFWYFSFRFATRYLFKLHQILDWSFFGIWYLVLLDLSGREQQESLPAFKNHKKERTKTNVKSKENLILLSRPFSTKSFRKEMNWRFVNALWHRINCVL